MYDIENYYQAESVKDAVRLLNEHPDARIISGGSDVLIKIRVHVLISPPVIVASFLYL